MAIEFTEVGKVCTGFSYPIVALYAASSGTITYSSGKELARGVSVQVAITASDANPFHANNQTAESVPGKFSSGTVTLTVDGLLKESEQLILGLPTADTDGWSAYGDEQKIPYVGLGYIARYMSGGVETWVPTVLPKVKFSEPSSSAATQEDAIDWQTQELTATIYRADDANHNWKLLGQDYATEEEALTALKTKLGITTSDTTTT